jgi:DNA topoisomerase-1
MICEREDEIDGFAQRMYWTVHGVIRLPDGSTVRADVGGAGGTAFSTVEEAKRVKAAIEGCRIADGGEDCGQAHEPAASGAVHDEHDATRVQHQARVWRFKTMQLAQELYEGGMITYMRTDSYSMALGAVESIRDVIRIKFGQAFVPSTPKVFTRKKAVNAQEAHEAVRPTDPSLGPQAVSYRGYGPAAVKLYELIRDRALASQAANSASDAVAVTFASGNGEDRVELRATGSKVAFPGYLGVLGREEDPSSEAVSNYEALSKLEEGQTVTVDSSHAEEHTTNPPPRYTEGTLIKAMEEHGIGRPSTYAPTLKLLFARNYVKSSKKRL